MTVDVVNDIAYGSIDTVSAQEELSYNLFAEMQNEIDCMIFKLFEERRKYKDIQFIICKIYSYLALIRFYVAIRYVYNPINNTPMAVRISWCFECLKRKFECLYQDTDLERFVNYLFSISTFNDFNESISSEAMGVNNNDSQIVSEAEQTGESNIQNNVLNTVNWQDGNYLIGQDNNEILNQ